MTDRRSGWPWEIQGTNDPRVSGAAAPIGETYRNVSTSDLFQKFGPGNFDWRLITGSVTAQQTAIVDPARGNDATGKFGDLALAFKTIQAAISAVPTPVDAATARTVWTILVSPGTYDENLAVDLTHGKKIILASWGPWNLGLFNSSNWQPSNERSITITTSDNVVFDFINPSFSIEPMLPVGTGDETEAAQHAVPRISGNIDLTGVAAGTPTLELFVEAQIYGTAASAASIEAGTTDVTLRVRRSRMRRIVEGSVLVLQDATESRFDQLIDIEGYGRIEECFLGNGMTVVATSPTNPNLPGFYDCQLNGTFTGPAFDAYWFDLVTSYWFGANGCTFAGGVTRRLVELTPTSQQTAIVDPVFGNDVTGTFGILAFPFKTIQAAISAVPTPTTGADARTVWTILVSPGTYDEDLAVDLTHGKKIILASWGPWNLGLFNSANWQPSNTRNITITTSDNVVFDFINPSFSIEPMLPAGTGDETEAAQHAVPRISGQINLTGVAAGTPTLELFIEAQIYGVAGVAIVAGTTDVTLRVHRSRMRGTVTGSVIILQDATESRFDQLIDIEGYGRIEECFLGNGMTIVGTSPSSNTTPGFYDCQLNGTFTGPVADAYWFDLVTSYWFGTNGCTFAGGVTRRLVELTPTSQQTAIVDPIFGNDATGTFGILAFPFKTIQAAISAVPTPVDAATARTVWTILVSPGTYDEDLAVDLTHGKKIILASWGPWNLGLFNNPNWQPSNERSITITTADNVVFDFINPSFSIEPMLPVGTGDETEAAQHSVPRISGNIDLTGVAAGTPTLELFVEAQIYGTAASATSIEAGTADVTLRVRRSRMRRIVEGSVLVLQDATESRFDQLIDIEGYGRIEECFLGNGMTVVATSPTNPNLPGIYDTQLNGTFTGPAGIDAFWFDLVTNYWFTTNGCVFAGGVTKRIVETANFSGGWLGDGSDGVAVIAVNTVLTRNMFYSSLTINPGIILDPGGYAIFCTGTVTINGSIERNGNPGTPGVPAVPGSGVGGVALASGFLFGSYAGGTGGFGGATPGAAGGSTLNSPRGYAGTGGAGGFAGFSAAGPGGTVTNEIPQAGDVRTIREMVLLRDAFGAYIDCGAGGGGGGGAGGGGAGGGGGSGGGVIMVAARAFSGVGPVRAVGGAGANGNGGAGPGAGGGGMGGFIGIVLAEGAPPTTDISGGPGGLLTVPGAAGSSGLVIVLTIQP